MSKNKFSFKKGDRVEIISMKQTGILIRYGKYTARVKPDNAEQFSPKERLVRGKTLYDPSRMEIVCEVTDLRHAPLVANLGWKDIWDSNE